MLKKIEMYLIVRYKNEKPVKDWVDITTMVQQGITINDSCDGTLDSGRLVFDIEEGTPLGNLDISQPLPPRTPIRIGEYNSEEDTKLMVSYIFMTSDTSMTPLRTQQTDDKGNVTFLYSHEVNFVELTKELEGKYAPNLSVRQPKSLYDKMYQRNVAWTFKYPDTVFYANGSMKALNASSYQQDRSVNNESGIVTIDNQNMSSLRIETEYDTDGTTPIAGIALEDYSFSFGLKIQSTAPQLINVKVWFVDDYRFVYPATNSNFPQAIGSGFMYDRLELKFTITLTYYNSNNQLIDTKTFNRTTAYRGDNTIRENDGGRVPIVGNNIAPEYANITIPRNANAAYVIVRTNYNTDNLMMFYDSSGPGYGGYKNKNWTWGNVADANCVRVGNNITTGDNGYRVAFRPVEYSVSFVSSTIQENQLDSYRTLYDVANKALQEINLKQRKKYTFSNKLTFLLQNKRAPEATLEDYNFRELLSKFCRMLEVIPILGDGDILDEGEDPLTTISCVKPGEQSIAYDIEKDEYIDLEKANTLEEYYDTISSRLYNLISEDDYHTETTVLQATETEYSQITQENAGFVTSYPIYWLRELIVTGIAIPYRYDGGSGVIRGNDPRYTPGDSRQTWNLTNRCFEEDIYNALPDVNYNTNPTTLSSGGRLGGFLSKANTFSYKSGSTFIKNVGHTGAAIPAYDPPFTSSRTEIPLYAMIEACVVEAYGIFYNNTPGFVIDEIIEDFMLQDFLEAQAKIIFTPLNEFTYRHTSNNARKIGKETEHRVNTQDKVSSYKDTTYYIKAEQEKQGNVIISPTFVYPNIMSCLQTGYKVDNNYVLTTRKLKIFNEYVECSYEFTQNYTLQNDNVKLDIEFERYSIPYDFVRREVLVYTHIIFDYNNQTLRDKYGADAGQNYPETHPKYIDLMTGFTPRDREMIAKVKMKYFVQQNGVPIQQDRNALLKLHLLTNSNQVSYIGKFVDNYSAGNQIWYQGGYNYVEPFRYCDSLGKVRKMQLGLYLGVNFLPRYFPDADRATTGGELILSTSMSENVFSQGDDKDSREGYEFNITANIESDTPNIIIYDVSRPINTTWLLRNDLETLTQETTIEDLVYSHSGTPPHTISVGTRNTRTYNIMIGLVGSSVNPNEAIALLNYDENQKEYTLVAILKNYPYYIKTNPLPGYEGDFYYTDLHAIATRYGKWEEN